MRGVRHRDSASAATVSFAIPLCVTGSEPEYAAWPMGDRNVSVERVTELMTNTNRNVILNYNTEIRHDDFYRYYVILRAGVVIQVECGAWID